jgi:hypothetical protein
MTPTQTPVKLTRTEDAYAHLAAFQRGDMVDVAGPCFYQPGTVTTAQQDGPGITRAYLVVTGCGTETRVTVASLLSGEYTIASVVDAQDGKVRYFDAVSYAMQDEAA